MRILHTMLRVNDLEESINFYKDFFGMDVLRQQDYPDGKVFSSLYWIWG